MGIGVPVRGRAQQCESREGRPARAFTFRQRLGRDLRVAAVNQGCPERVVAKGCLDQDFTRAIRASCTTRDLDDRLGQPLGTAEVGAE